MNRKNFLNLFPINLSFISEEKKSIYYYYNTTKLLVPFMKNLSRALQANNYQARVCFKHNSHFNPSATSWQKAGKLITLSDFAISGVLVGC